MRSLIARLVRDDDGQDIIEYALLAAFVGLAGVGLFNAIAGSMGASYRSWDVGINSLWEPADPIQVP